MQRHVAFCVRDIRDYIAAVIDVKDFYAVPDFDPKFPPLNDAPTIQEVLLGCVKSYGDCEQFLNASICGETDIIEVKI